MTGIYFITLLPHCHHHYHQKSKITTTARNFVWHLRFPVLYKDSKFETIPEVVDTVTKNNYLHVTCVLKKLYKAKALTKYVNFLQKDLYHPVFEGIINIVNSFPIFVTVFFLKFFLKT